MSELENDSVKLPRKTYDKVMAYIDLMESEIKEIKEKLLSQR